MNFSTDWETRIRDRFSIIIYSAAALRAGHRKHDDVLRELWQAWNELDFLVKIFPETAENFTVKTARDIVAHRIDMITAEIEEKEKTASDDDDEDHAKT